VPAPRSDLDFVNRALSLLGEDELASLDAGEGAAGAIAVVLYEAAKENLLAQWEWKFALTNVSSAGLKLSAASPSFDRWAYKFALPADMVRLVSAGEANTRYSIHRDAGDVSRMLFANFSTLILGYIAEVAESEFPPYFQNALTMQLAAEFAIAITEDTNKAQLFAAQAGRALRVARVRDYEMVAAFELDDGGLVSERFG